MPLKKSTGNMYTWVTHTHTHLGGECPHECTYCYVDNPRFGRPERYKGQIRLVDQEFSVDYGSGKTIFVENCQDLFAEDIPSFMIAKVLNHCNTYPDNTYVFQTKNPGRLIDGPYILPPHALFGCTIETNRDTAEISDAPSPRDRMTAMTAFRGRKFITIEPMLDFDLDILPRWIADINPEFVNVGADSKGHGLPEPQSFKVKEFLTRLEALGVKVIAKDNLLRLTLKSHRRNP